MTAVAVQERPSHSTTEAWTPERCAPGRPWPLGATLQEGGVNFAVFSSVAEAVELCVFDDTGTQELRRIHLACRTDDIWHGFVAGLAAGTRYGLRVHGPYDPEAGVRCNPHKVLVDPYARAIDRPVNGAEWQFGYTLGNPEFDLQMDTADTAAHAPKGVVLDPSFDWEGDRPPNIAWADTVFYEVHVRGFTKQMPDVPEQLRGTFSGLASDAAIAHLKRLGITSVELLPIHAFNNEQRLIELGLANYWGYNTLAFFAPEPRYCVGGDANDFRRMVKRLHAAGLEVILDVVYNHSCEGNHLGPTLSFKGIDHAAYYRLTEDRRYCADVTGTGNTMDASHPATLRLIMDSLRYWVQEMHVDGFRFDLAPASARDAIGDYHHRSPFLTAVAQDPVLRTVKLIAEPWDIGMNGYQVGGFPPGWAEWNGRYRDSVRDFWRGTDGSLQEFAGRLAGSADIFGPSRRAPTASVNLVTVHDGFTLNDLVSYNDKHNEANGEDNRDGESHNRSWNCGAEGPTDDPGVNALRERQKRNFIATLFVSRGVPLLLGGDEMSRTQGGNNNAYCQDSPISWYDWSDLRRDDPMVAFTRFMVSLRRELPVLRADTWPNGDVDADGRCDLAWYSVWGLPMTQEEWTTPSVRCVAALLDGRFAPVDGRPSPSVLLLFNASHEEVTFTFPQQTTGLGPWSLRVHTGEGCFPAENAMRIGSQAMMELHAHSMALLVESQEDRETE